VKGLKKRVKYVGIYIYIFFKDQINKDRTTKGEIRPFHCLRDKSNKKKNTSENTTRESN
jgi:hypothetical protein